MQARMPCSWQQDRNLIANVHDVLGLAMWRNVVWWGWSSFRTSQHPGWRTVFNAAKAMRQILVKQLKCGMWLSWGMAPWPYILVNMQERDGRTWGVPIFGMQPALTSTPGQSPTIAFSQAGQTAPQLCPIKMTSFTSFTSLILSICFTVSYYLSLSLTSFTTSLYPSLLFLSFTICHFIHFFHDVTLCIISTCITKSLCSIMYHYVTCITIYHHCFYRQDFLLRRELFQFL